MKTPNYLAKLPQEATIKSIQVLKDYDLITLDVPTASQRLCPHCGSNDIPYLLIIFFTILIIPVRLNKFITARIISSLKLHVVYFFTINLYPC